MRNVKSEFYVGIFLIAALAALLFLCLRVADSTSFSRQPTWTLYANFNNIGGLKTSSPVKIGGVVIGRVTSIGLNTQNFTPRVTMAIDKRYDNAIPDTSSIAIRTQGLLGEQYIALNPGFDDPDLGSTMLKDGDVIQDTKSAIVLEDLIGQFLYKDSNKNEIQKEVSKETNIEPVQ